MSNYTSNDSSLRYPIINTLLNEPGTDQKPCNKFKCFFDLLKNFFCFKTQKPKTLLDRVTPEQLQYAQQLRQRSPKRLS
jgi:hypothetical protein